MNAEELLKKFKADLEQKLKREVEYYDFELTGACQKWIDSIVTHYSNGISDLIDDISDYCISDYTDEFDELEEEYEFDWPDDGEAGAIVGKALRNDSSHFEYITGELDYSMAPSDCIKAEWFWTGSIRPSVIDFIQDWINENIDDK